ncbi:MAG: SprB repeat-containing protein [Lewinellaceae bacterium]|nr:SprB repeat-containing protein [Lewinellaceae bacterium]
MIRNILLLPILCLAIVAQAQYSEPFSTPNKGYKISCVDDFTTVNWSLSPWDPGGTCQPGDLRDANDYFNTSAGGLLESSDLDQEVCWESPLINTTTANPVSIEMDLTWAGFDVDPIAGLCEGDYIKVLYSVNGGAYTMIPNVKGGNACATIAYPFGSTPPSSDNVHINHMGIPGGSTLKIRVCVFTNVTAEIVTIDNVSVPQTGVNVGCAQPTLSTVTTQVGCSNPNSGTIDLTVSGGTPGYTYSWTGGATTQDRSGLAVGTYTVTVTDAASCSATISANITNAPTLTLTTQVLDASCNGNFDGEISLDVTGGVPGYTYDWSNDGPENPDNDPQDLVGLGVGTYTVTVTDATGCTATKSATVNVQPSGAYLEQFNLVNKGYLANYVDDFAGVAWTMSSWTPGPPFGREVNDYFKTGGGVLTGIDFDQEVCWTSPLIDLNGGTQFSVFLSWTLFDQEDYINVNYSIDGGAYVQVPNVVGGGTGTIDYPSGASDQSGNTTVTKTGLSGGTIQIQVCGNFNTESMTVDNVSIPGSNNYCPAPEPSLTKTNVSCNGGANGTITTTVTNGTAPFTYAWSDGGVTTQNRTGLSAGTYTVTVSDANMATGTASIIITQPPVIILTETHVNVLCNGASTGSIDLTVSGGTGAYSYSWTGGATTQDRSGLAAGTYTVTVSDANSCTKTLSVTITQPVAIVLTETHVNILCNGAPTGSIDLTVSGGTGAYIFLDGRCDHAGPLWPYRRHLHGDRNRCQRLHENPFHHHYTT